MKTQKLSLGSIKNMLSRGEMKKIMAGSGGGLCDQGSLCNTWPRPALPCCNLCAPINQYPDQDRCQ